MTRYVVVGAGAVGVTLAAELHESGSEVLLVARGAQLAALREKRLRFARPSGVITLDLPFAAGPDEVALAEGDVLVLAVKAQDTEQTVADWAWRPVALPDGGQDLAARALPVVVLQNGLDSERTALRRFEVVLGTSIWIPSVYVEEGVVVNPAAPTPAVLWIGRYPHGDDHPALNRLAVDLRAAAIQVQLVPEIIGWKTVKLVANTENALDALYRDSPLRAQAIRLLADEARAVFTRAGLPIVDRGRLSTVDLSGFHSQQIPGHPRGGSSTWQSLARSGSLEVDFLNGEVLLQARLAGVEAPANAAVLERIRRAVLEGTPVGSLDDADLAATLPGLRTLALVPDDERSTVQVAAEEEG
jgi:2-dehydropantoate 2-reductase